jgi:hypothetical protein
MSVYSKLDAPSLKNETEAKVSLMVYHGQTSNRTKTSRAYIGQRTRISRALPLRHLAGAKEKETGEQTETEWLRYGKRSD